MFRTVLLPCFLFLSFLSSASAAPSFDVSLSRDQIRADETAEVKIQVSWPAKEGNYSFGIPTPHLENLQLTNQAQSQETFPQNGEPWTRKTFTWELTPQKPGQGIIESFSITYVDTSVLEPAPSQYDVRTLVVKVTKLPYQMPGWLKTLLGILGVLIAGGGVWALLKRKRYYTGMPDPREEEKMTIEDAAIRTTQQAATLQDLSRALEDYLGRLYPEYRGKSEFEIIRALETSNLGNEEKRSLHNILNALAEARYTGQTAGDALFQNLQKSVISYIESKRVVGSPA